VPRLRAPLRWSGRRRRACASRIASAVMAALAAGGCAAAPIAPSTTDGGREVDTTVPSPSTVVGDVPRVGLIQGTPPRAGEPTATTSPHTTLGTGTPCGSYTLTHVNFATNSAGVTGAAASYVSQLAATLVACHCPSALHGFADPRPTSYPGGNQQLSFDRAWTVRTELLARGVPPELVVDVLGHGTDDPVPGDLAASRRVEIVLECPGR
jgi:outer membrane protein OmpA-like peptidoglycan-associated protein